MPWSLIVIGFDITVMLQPRLGPKPFTPPKLSLDNTSSASELDRVFSVPAVPSSPALNGATSHSPPAADSTLAPSDLDKTPEVCQALFRWNYYNQLYFVLYGSVFLRFFGWFFSNLMCFSGVLQMDLQGIIITSELNLTGAS